MPLTVTQKTDIQCILCMQISTQDKIIQILQNLNIDISSRIKISLERALSQSIKSVFAVLEEFLSGSKKSNEENAKDKDSQKAKIIPLSGKIPAKSVSIGEFDDCDRNPKDEEFDYVIVQAQQNAR